MFRASWYRPVFLVFLTFFTACKGNIRVFNGANGVPGGDTSPDLEQSKKDMVKQSNHLPVLQVCQQAGTPAPRQLRRLTRTELFNSLKDIFQKNDLQFNASLFSDDPKSYTFYNVSPYLVVSAASGSQLQGMAESIAEQVVKNGLDKVASCQTADNMCLSKLINDLGLKMFRQPLTAEMTQQYLDLVKGQADFKAAAASIIDAMIQSPYFLYRSELGVKDEKTKLFVLTPYEIATELAYVFTGSTPDAELLTAASKNELSTEAQIQKQVERLAMNGKAKETIRTFFLQWLMVYDLPNKSRQQDSTMLSPAQSLAMVKETGMNIDDLLSNNANYSMLHTFNTTYVNQELATFYGLSAPQASKDNFTKVSIGKRAPGILFQGGVLSSASEVNLPSPTLRGLMIREHLLCNTIPPPPPNLAASAVPPSENLPNMTTRDMYEKIHLQKDQVCSTCHVKMDPIAFTQSEYDTLGRIFPNGRENGGVLNSNGYIINADGLTEPLELKNAAALSEYFAQSKQAKACFARNWAMYALGMTDFAQNGCTFDELSAEGEKLNYDLKKTIYSFTKIKSFRERVQDI